MKLSRILFLLFAFLSFLYRIFLDLLSLRSVKNPVPDNLSDVYDAEKYDKWKRYTHETVRLSLVSDTALFLLNAVLIASGAFRFVRALTDDPYLTTVYTLLFYLLLDEIVSCVFGWISAFRIEKSFGFSNTTGKTFILDTVKSTVIECVVVIGLMLLLQLLYNAVGDYIILIFAAILFVIILSVMLLMPFFSGLFNKFTPLENKDLEKRLTDMLAGNGITVRSIRVMNASLRTTRSNAYFTGLGKTKSIVLYDNLVNNFTDDEIVAVFAHEMGHAIHRDTARNSLLSLGNIVLIVLAVWALIKANFWGDFGFDGVNYGLVFFLTFQTVLPLIDPLIGFVGNAFSRRAEYRADRMAKDAGYAEALVSALKKLGRENLSDLSPDKTLVALTYSHPTLEQRINALQKD